MEKKSIKARLKTFARKNRSVCMAAVAVVIAVSLAATFLVADQFMNFSIGSEAAEADITAGDATTVERSGIGEKKVTAHFTLTGIDESNADTVKNTIMLSLYNGTTSITADSVTVTEKSATSSEDVSSVESTESGEDVSSVESTESGEDVSSVESTESGEDVSSVENTESGEDVSSVESTESGEDVSSVESTESGEDVSSVESTESGEVSSVESTESGSSSTVTKYDYDIEIVFTVGSTVKSVSYTISYGGVTKCGTIAIENDTNIEVNDMPSIKSVTTSSAYVEGTDEKTYFNGELKLLITTENMQNDYSVAVSCGNAKTINISGNEATLTFDNGEEVGSITVKICDANKTELTSATFGESEDWIADSTAPTATIDSNVYEIKEDGSYSKVNKRKTSSNEIAFKFYITEDGSGLKETQDAKLYYSEDKLCEGKDKLCKGNVTLEKDDSGKDVYCAKFNLLKAIQDESTFLYFYKVSIVLYDNVDNKREVTYSFYENQYLLSPNASVEAKKDNNSETDETEATLYVKNSDTINYQINVEYSTSISEIKIKGDFINSDNSGDEIVLRQTEYDTENCISKFTFKYTITQTATTDENGVTSHSNPYNDNTTLEITSIMCNVDETADKQVSISEQPKVVYYAPIDHTYADVNVNVNTSNSNTTAICNGDELTINAYISEQKNDNHAVSLKDVVVEYSIGDNVIGIVVNNTATVLSATSYTDMSTVKYKVTYKLVDAAGNETNDSKEISEESKIIYYAPLNENNVSVSLTTSNSNKAYSKNDDKLTVSATPKNNLKNNPDEKHTLSVVDNSFKLVKSVSENTDDALAAASANAFKIPENYFEDDTEICYDVTFIDVAGQTYVITKKSSGITYLAPIELKDGTISFTSDANDKTYAKYAKKGSNLTLEATANHAVSCDDASVNADNYDVNIKEKTVEINEKNVRFTFKSINVTTEADNGKTVNVTSATLTPSFTLTDAAGNEYSSENMPSITYDGKSPNVSISPKLDGFSKDDFGFTVTFKDENLYGEGMVLNYGKNSNATTNILDTSTFTDGQPEFSKSLTLSEEGTYKISASVKDKAGNTASNGGMTITIDKTKPEIVSATISPDSIQVFKKGFVISDYLEWVEDYLNEVICKLSDGSGTYDWDISQPITDEGKKTVSIIITDMAGNTCSYTFEVYIDATAPAPVVKDTISATVLTSEKENTITKEFKLFVSLENQQIADEAPDEFTSLKLLDEEGNVVHDFIKEDGLNSTYEYDITEYGKYSLVLEAKDSAISADGGDGNTVGPVTYEINFTQGTIFDIIAENPVLYYSIISVLAIAAIAGAVFLIRFLKKKSKKEA